MTTTLKGFASWEKQRLRVFKTKLGIVRVVIEYNVHYGDLITQFEVNENRLTTVRFKYPPHDFLPCNTCNGLIGERPFEQDCLVYEFLLKPLGISLDTHQRVGAGGWMVISSSYHHFFTQLLAQGAEQLDSDE